MHRPHCEVSEKVSSTTQQDASITPPEAAPTLGLEKTTTITQIEKPEKALLRTSPHLSAPSLLSVNDCCAPPAQVTAITTKKMAISKSNRIIILLVIDSAFFIVELVVGKGIGTTLATGSMLMRISRLCRPFTRSGRRLLPHGLFSAYI